MPELFGVLFRKLPPVPMHLQLFLTFPSIRFSVSGFLLRFLIHLDLGFVPDYSNSRNGTVLIVFKGL